MSVKATVGLAGILIFASGLAGEAAAAPVVYDFSSGFVVLSANLGSTDILPAGTQIALTGGQVTFDSSAMTLPSFSFLDNTATTVALSGGPWSGEMLTLQSLSVGPGSGYASSATFVGSPPPTYTLNVDKISAAGFYSLSGPVTRASTAFQNPPGSDSALTGSISLGSDDTIQLTGITLGTVTVNGQTITLKGDVVFEGATPVPIPPAAWLLGSCLLVAPLMRRRRNSSELPGLAT